MNVGDWIAFDPQPALQPGGYIHSRHLDDKAAVVETGNDIRIALIWPWPACCPIPENFWRRTERCRPEPT